MKTTERDIRKYREVVEETPILESKIRAFPLPSIEFTITPPKHEKRVLKKAEKPSINNSIPAPYDVEFHVFNETKDIDFQVNKHTIEKNVQPGVSNKKLTYQGVARKMYPKVKKIPISFYDPNSKDYMAVDKYYDRRDETYRGVYNVKAKLLKDGVVLAESNQLSWDIFEEERRKRQEKQERWENERKQEEIERKRQASEVQQKIDKILDEREKMKSLLRESNPVEYLRLFEENKKRNRCICR